MAREAVGAHDGVAQLTALMFARQPRMPGVFPSLSSPHMCARASAIVLGVVFWSVPSSARSGSRMLRPAGPIGEQTSVRSDIAMPHDTEHRPHAGGHSRSMRRIDIGA